jgi:hypothetical protein
MPRSPKDPPSHKAQASGAIKDNITSQAFFARQWLAFSFRSQHWYRGPRNIYRFHNKIAKAVTGSVTKT